MWLSCIISTVWKDVAETPGQWWMENRAVAPDGRDGPLSKCKPWWFLSQSSLLAYCETLRNMSINVWLKEVVTNRNSRDFLQKCWTQNEWSELLSKLFFLLKMINTRMLVVFSVCKNAITNSDVWSELTVMKLKRWSSEILGGGDYLFIIFLICCKHWTKIVTSTQLIKWSAKLILTTLKVFHLKSDWNIF